MENNKQALLYVRVSSKEQEKEGYSLDAQEKLGEDYALRNDLKIVKRWKVSESAWRKERAAFNEMVDYAKRNENIKHIIFDVTDRMTRNDMDKIRIYTLIKLHNKKVHFSRTNKCIDKYSRSDDEFVLDIEVAVAKKMSNDISWKTKTGMIEKAEQGLYPSYAPLGYKNNLVTHMIEVDEDIAPYIQKAFTLVASGDYSLRKVTKFLHREGFRSKKGKRASSAVVHYLLRNPVYYGALRWCDRKYQGSHVAIISKELFDKVQRVLSGNFRPRNNQNIAFFFNDLIRCGICGCKVIGEMKKSKYKYYHCTFSKGRHQGINYMREERVADLLGQPVKRITLSKEIAEWLMDALRESDKNMFELREKRLNALRGHQEKIMTKLDRILEMRIDDEISEETFKSKEQEYQNQLIDINSQIEGANDYNENWLEDAKRIFELSKRLHSLYLKADYGEKAKLLKMLASNFLLNGEKLEPVYKMPFNLLAKEDGCTNGSPSRTRTRKSEA
ncbi:MAG: hypothetical protein A2Y62_18070 [Candidatus Fischerbacteria bacterium RBG_13_37_8]|uniref:Recombinase domain-containing protein n=1 Tax=Candidatus Fischerbacteria bacterium RBG_13_37_8 TaxID=1817863 RepID=A0A1F5VW15_9BACT|nr:MAG: hypothetical protein A2Y62_18070 [Candidatus Fischerbacteria bacterium RBG_13_37_8]